MMCDRSRHGELLAASALALFGFACAPAGGELLADGVARYPDARVVDGGRIRRDAGARDATSTLPDPDAGVADSGSDDAAGSPSDSGAPGATPTWYGEIRPLMESRCSLCHGVPTAGGAPRSLTRYADMLQTNLFGQPIHEIVGYRLAAGTMPPSGYPRFTADETEMILAWSAAGAPEGVRPDEPDSGIDDAGVPDGGADGGVLFPWTGGEQEFEAGAGRRWFNVWANDGTGSRTSPWIAQRTGDGTSYTCFSFVIPPNPSGSGLAESAIEFHPVIDDDAHVHHLFAYHDTSGQDPDGPFDCLGNQSYGRIIGSWFPGRGATILPEGTGVPIQPGQRVTLEVHYDSVPAAGAPDMSGFSILLTEAQGLTPAGEVWAGVSWQQPLFGPGNVTLQATVTNTFDNVTLFTATTHMHNKGLAISLEYSRAATPNNWQMIVETDPWLFDNQILLPIEPPLVLQIGDQVRTTCTWTTADGPVIQGAGSQQEMCYVFMYHYRPQLLPDSAFVGLAQ
jgi:hypothetical protein